MDTNIYLIYSQYCKYCKKILSKLPSLQKNINKICIDNQQFRKRILNNQLYTIEYVPCIIIFKDENVTIYQGLDASNYINDQINIINNQNNQYKKIQIDLEKSYKQLENEKINSFKLQNTIIELQKRLDNQTTELTSKHIEREQPIKQVVHKSMRTSISDLMDDSDEDDETIIERPPSINDLAKRLQEGRQ